MCSIEQKRTHKPAVQAWPGLVVEPAAHLLTQAGLGPIAPQAQWRRLPCTSQYVNRLSACQPLRKKRRHKIVLWWLETFARNLIACRYAIEKWLVRRNELVEVSSQSASNTPQCGRLSSAGLPRCQAPYPNKAKSSYRDTGLATNSECISVPRHCVISFEVFEGDCRGRRHRVTMGHRMVLHAGRRMFQ